MKNKNIDNLLSMITLNIKTFIKFELLYKIILCAVFVPISLSCFDTILRQIGYSTINAKNILEIIFNPGIIVFTILIILLIAAVTLFEISTIIVIQDLSYHNKKITLREAIKISIYKFKYFFIEGNYQNIFYLLLLTPILNISLITFILSVIRIPTSILNLITANSNIFIIVFLLYLLLVALLSDRLFMMHYMIVEDQNITSSKNKSARLIKNKELKDHIKVLIPQIILTITVIGLITIGKYVLPILSSYLNDFTSLTKLSDGIIMFIVVIVFVIVATISSGLNFSMISYLFYTHKKAKKERIYKLKYDESYSITILKRVVKCTVGAIIILLGLLSYANQKTVLVENKPTVVAPVPAKEKKHHIEVTAHRGASAIYPENTIAAFRGAVVQNADWIEIDIRQSADGYLVVSHNLNLMSTANVNADIDTLTIDQIKSIDVGWKKGPMFVGEQIPTLDEAIEFAIENNIKLNIEIKVTGKESNYEQQIADTIKAHNFEDKCLVSSYVTSTLEGIKALDSNIKTAVITTFNVNEVYDLPYIDGYSIDSSCIDQGLVDLIHANNKEIYAWTINTEEKINEMINLGVDNIITDDVSLAKLLIGDREMNSITIKSNK